MSSKSAPRILIADDNVAARITIRELLRWHSFDVCGEAQDGDIAIEKTVRLRPDIVVLDINMPRMNGVDAAHEIRRLRPKTKIVFLTIHDTPVVAAALRQWAHGFVCKADAGITLVPTLNRLARTPRLSVTAPLAHGDDHTEPSEISLRSHKR
jgi:DNA-binding NarL/FixJ family response regulator